MSSIWNGQSCKPEKGCKISLATLIFSGAAGRNRTHDPLVRSQVLYPAELQPRKSSIVYVFCLNGENHRKNYLRSMGFYYVWKLGWRIVDPLA